MTNKSNLIKWNLSEPLKFSALFCTVSLVVSFIYMMLARTMSDNLIFSQQPLMAIIFVCFIICAYYMFRRLPRAPLSQKSFIALHTSQIAIAPTIFILLTLIVSSNFDKIIFNLIQLESKSPLLFFITLVLSAMIIMYITGVSLSNLYAKFWRIRAFNVPAWKIVFSLPFGFAGLWSAGYFLDSPDKKLHPVTVKTKWYSELINKITNSTTNLVIAFIATTLFSGLFIGLNNVLLTLLLSTIFGICLCHTNKQHFIKNISGKYANAMIIINIIMIIIFSSILAMRPLPPQASTPASETITITDTTQGNTK